jgi:hypothetical protein
LVDSPGNVLGQREDFLDERDEIRLVVLYSPGEHLRTRDVNHVRPVELLADVHAGPGLLLHDHHLRRSPTASPQEVPPAAPYAANYPRGSLLAVGNSSARTGGDSPQAIFSG